MKKLHHRWVSLALTMLLAAALVAGALAEGLTVEYDWTGERTVAAAEATGDEVMSEAAEPATPEVEEELPAWGEADIEDMAAVSAAAGVVIDKAHFPDSTFRAYVKEQFDTDGDGALSRDECEAVKSVKADRMNITSVKGIEWFPNLTELDCEVNKLKSLDVSRNTALTKLVCGCKDLTSLDVRNNTALTVLDCSNTQLKSLDLSRNTALKELECTNNHQLTKLDVRDHKALKRLACYYNNLKELNVHGCTALTVLYCSSNHLKSLDLSTNTALKDLDCDDNQLTSLDVSKNTRLEHLQCDSCQLRSLDVSGNTRIHGLSVRYNKITSLKVRGCTHLDGLVCYGNQLTSLDVSGCTNLSELYCYWNPLSSLDVSNCNGLINAVKAGAYEAYEPEDDIVGFHWEEGMMYDYVIHTDSTTAVIANGEVLYRNKGPVPGPKSLAELEAAVTVGAQVYTGKALKPDVTVMLGAYELQEGADYTVSYKNNKAIGKATVIVKGMGRYTGTVKKAYKINPKKVSGLKLTAGAKQLTASWKKATGITGYELQCGLRKNFAGARTLTVKSAKTAKAAIRKLDAGKTYYVRIRAYKTVKNVKYFSAWSKAVNIILSSI